MIAVCGRDSCQTRYPESLLRCPTCGNTARKMKPDDPARVLLRGQPSRKTVHREGCYICEDSEFAAMGLPLCFACRACGGHVAADDCVCDVCGADQRDVPDPDPNNGAETDWFADGGAS